MRSFRPSVKNIYLEWEHCTYLPQTIWRAHFREIRLVLACALVGERLNSQTMYQSRSVSPVLSHAKRSISYDSLAIYISLLGIIIHNFNIQRCIYSNTQCYPPTLQITVVSSLISRRLAYFEFLCLSQIIKKSPISFAEIVKKFKTAEQQLCQTVSAAISKHYSSQQSLSDHWHLPNCSRETKYQLSSRRRIHIHIHIRTFVITNNK